MKRLFLVLALVGVLSAGIMLLTGPDVSAGPSSVDSSRSQICEGIGAASGRGCDDTSSSITNTIKNLLNIFSVIVGIVAVIMIIVGGFKYITSGGDSNKVQAAKSTIIYAVIGLIVVAFAQAIVQFVLNKTI